MGFTAKLGSDSNNYSFKSELNSFMEKRVSQLLLSMVTEETFHI